MFNILLYFFAQYPSCDKGGFRAMNHLFGKSISVHRADFSDFWVNYVWKQCCLAGRKKKNQTTKRTNMMNNTETDLWNIMLRLLCKKGKHSTAQVWGRILVTFALLRKISLTCWFQNSRAKILCGVPVSHLLGCWLSGEPAAKPPVHLLSMPSSLQQQNKICLPVRACLKMLTILL